ncbi:hypothetical protein [Streptomyces profundus]|uniref:hypothetical protein n=1 Tax=Streptomyces profundus TaxID=2867410 RepID=UPI001D1661EC|nr:hypothetical protein [Streptomyces sp. MA3_2.13]UED87450.1 hypothetical protein K4G22_27365 [Streptomyces sp. MA3_2.13]
MIRTENVNRVVRQAAAGRWALRGARRQGLRDGARGLPHVPRPGPLPLAAGSAVSSYVTEQRATAGRAVEQLRSRLLHREWRLVTEIRYQAVQVVTHYDARGLTAPAALARFGQRVGEWRTKAEVCRYRAGAVTEQFNQRIACYWDAVRHHHRDVPDPAPAYLAHWAPAPVELDATWLRPDGWLTLTDGTSVSATGRALELLDGHGRTTPRGGR